MKKALASSGVSKERHHRCYKLPATRVKSCSHVKALILLDIWKTGFCLINYPSQSMAKKNMPALLMIQGAHLHQWSG